MSSDVAISVKGLSKCYQIYGKPHDRLLQMFFRGRKTLYREFWALREIDFEVRRGETVGIIGRNGSGKSTLLQLICGTLNATFGTVETRGRIAALLELGSGFNPEFSGRENVYLNAALYGLSREEIQERFDSILEFSEIGEFIDQPVKTYSSGMFVRLAFAVVAHVDADILIIDEALAVGDIRFQNKCQRKLEEFRKSGCSILFVSHSPGLVEAFCDHAIWLDGGRLQAAGKPADLIRDYVNAMAHGLARPDGDSVAAEAEAPGDLPAMAADIEREWPWLPVGPQHNVRQLSRARIQSVRVRINGECGASLVEAMSSALEVEALVEFFDPVLRPLIAVGVFNHLNEPLVHVNSFNLDDAPDPAEGGTFRVLRGVLNLPALRSGEYLVSVGIDDGEPGASEILCHVYAAWAFRVKTHCKRKDQGGYIQLEDAKLSLELAEFVR
jgi:lipopolysaccharide transport system ATP-binding protein